jgi:hypothetical protein
LKQVVVKRLLKQEGSTLNRQFMIWIRCDSLDDLNGQAIAWRNKVNAKVHTAIRDQ